MFVFTKRAKKQYLSLEPRLQKQIKQKLILLKQDQQLLNQNIKPLINMQPLTHRVRIGCYRLLLTFDKVENKFIVVKVAHRKDVYK